MRNAHKIAEGELNDLVDYLKSLLPAEKKWSFRTECAGL
jgi:hypothetical protein